MKIQLLGTAAAPLWPGLFDKGEYSEKIRHWSDKNIRSRSQALIDDEHLIDFNMENFYHTIKFDLDFSKLRDIFITHRHDDHFVPGELEFISQGCYAYNTKYTPIKFYGNREVIEMAKPFDSDGIVLNELKPYDTVVTEDGYKWTAIPAKHNTEEPLNYIIQKDNKTLLYKVDSASYTDEKLWEFLKTFKFDCIISECTFTFDKEEHVDHENYETVLNFKKKLLEFGSIDDNTPFWLTHIHYISNGLCHEEMEEIVSKDNIYVAYDGVIINI